jgi:hypothetical protein
MSLNQIRESRRQKKRKQKLTTALIWGSIAVALVVVLGVVVWNAIRPAAGESVPIMANAGDHVPEGTDPGPFNTNPPTSGPHYAEEYEAGFYDEFSPEAQAPYPEGYLGHNLEHGYVIYWYNCDLLEENECAALKTQIQESMEDSGGTKLIAFPRDSLDVSVVMTSWGQMQRFENFDLRAARRFVSANRYRAPEPNAP